jgi:fructuronate reductase/mannitol 2-dehydrogenase
MSVRNSAEPSAGLPEQPTPLCDDQWVSARHDDERGSASDQIDIPGYERAALTPAVVHIGVGGFHRAHQAVYFDDLVREGISTDWGLVGVGLRSPEMGQVLADQDNLYTVVTRNPDHDDLRVVGVITDYLFAPDDPSLVLDTLSRPTTRLVTLTITGNGYPPGGLVDAEDPDVAADLAQPGAPRTVFGFLVEALDRRRRAGLPAFTVLSCDNVQHNGAITRQAVVSMARLRDPSLARWIDEQATFPSSMVDRITPETTPEMQQELARQYGLEDRWPVITEPFSQWVVEDSFVGGRPPLDRVGVQFVPDVLPYEIMKTRLLNGAHCALGHLGYLAGLRTTDEAMADPRLRDFIDGYLHEAAALLPAVPGIDLQEYCEALLERFANPQLGDQLSRLCRRGSTKVPSYVFPSVELALSDDRPRAHLVMALAAWLRYLRGQDYAGEPIPVEDARAEQLRPLAEQAPRDSSSVLSEQDIFGNLGDHEDLPAELEWALRLLEEGPLEAALAVSASQQPVS